VAAQAAGARGSTSLSLADSIKVYQAWFADVLAHLQDHPARHVAELLPWNWKKLQHQQQRAAA
jgi:transposase